ncbi:protein-L-isoaspartate(D-aspartate) O-methyltransferase [Endozoicomonas sp. GU-1]|uniref:protein-L-isoaspartate(D-aspartate) O-methyltransferase n=1 Tax=Endozoicomonas sp. GU-1 TaxID=3009078 RepID=UPI0022B3F6C0|nr:protein-L-isoaspartate(D-aspartate) O-methyltransferase [Endozoicomonas sp. GU-1]WBA79707.1 protein-L-isoaspartate(D-aspartate) O-methyltransferase [Endozoicomonas sp. GU-1]WBA87293.1 protein-L-isoaspartate(D-aspartate) O-methyltransferase [Endozoicomonas sp. GU-1]
MRDLEIDGIGMTSRRTRERLIQRLMDQGIQSGKVLDAIRTIPRHLFLDEALAHRAYEDTALPIGHNQTLSQPYIVAKMTEVLLARGELNKVLEIGTGSGYQTAVLASLVARVCSVERIRPLQEKAQQRLSRLSLKNVRLRHTDGGMGWPEESPFDGIIVTAAPGEIPAALLSQLSPEGGRLVIPVGGNNLQDLVLVTRNGDEYQRKVLEAVRFVPLLAGVIR